METGDICKVDGCNETIWSQHRGFCLKHNSLFMKNKIDINGTDIQTFKSHKITPSRDDKLLDEIAATVEKRKQFIADVIRLKDEGYKVVEIARIYNVSSSRVSMLLKKHLPI